MLGDSNRKIIVLALLIILTVSTIGIYTWYTQYRNWSIEELDSKVVGDNDHDIYDHRYDFESDRAGEKVTVEGKVTSLTSYSTNQGKFTEIELDNYGQLNLFKKGSFDHEVGDKVTIDVKFENGYLNGEQMTFSPQFHPDFLATSIQKIVWEANDIGGFKLDQTMASDQTLRVSIEGSSNEVSLSEASCSLYSGAHDLRDDYEMTNKENIPRPDEQLMVDYGELSDGKEKENVIYHDENDNGILDEGDYFEIDGLERPDSSLSLNTYHLFIDSENTDSNPPSWNSYIIMNDNGLLRFE